MRSRLVAALLALAAAPHIFLGPDSRFALVWGPSVVTAQLPDSLPPTASPYQISVLTVGVGAEVWERFGHNMIRVRDTLTGEDVTYDWGRFSFADKGFLPHFVMGRMRYWMGNDATQRSLLLYQYRDRTVVEQHLALTATERDSLVAFLRWNVQEENRFYRYDYYRDNCSTRLRDALDRVLGGAIRAASDTVLTGTTYREETRRLTEPDLPLYTGLMLGLGPTTDRPLTGWDDMFLPVRTMEQLRRVTITGPEGSRTLLVSSEDTLYLSTRFTEPGNAPREVPLFLGIGVGVGVLLAAVGRLRRPKLFLVLGGFFALVLGLGGALLLFLMSFTDHAVTYGNENALLVSFLALLLTLSLRPAMHGSPAAGRLATALALALVGLGVVALLLKVVMPTHQDTWETLALLLPIDLGLALGTIYALSGPTWRPPRGER